MLNSFMQAWCGKLLRRNMIAEYWGPCKGGWVKLMCIVMRMHKHQPGPYVTFPKALVSDINGSGCLCNVIHEAHVLRQGFKLEQLNFSHTWPVWACHACCTCNVMSLVNKFMKYAQVVIPIDCIVCTVIGCQCWHVISFIAWFLSPPCSPT